MKDKIVIDGVEYERYDFSAPPINHGVAFVNGVWYNKIKQEFPIVFKGTSWTFRVLANGDLELSNTEHGFKFLGTCNSHQALRDAIKKSDEIRGIQNA